MSVSVIISSCTVTVFAFKNMAKGLLNLHLIRPTIISIISKGSSCEKDKTMKYLVVPALFLNNYFNIFCFQQFFN